MQAFELTFIYTTEDGTLNRSQSRPVRFEKETKEDAKRTAEGMIESESTGHRTVQIGVLTRTLPDEDVMEVTRWHRESGWADV